MPDVDRDARWQRHWDKHSRTYDKQMGFFDRVLFGDSRRWVCSQAYGIDLSEQMLRIAKERAAAIGRQVDLRQGNAHELPFGDAAFDAVVCTFSLCAIPDVDRAVAEMWRVLRPGGRLLLADHVAGAVWPVRVVQRLLEVVTVPIGGEHFRRRPINQVRAAGFVIERSERFKLGLVERVCARRPGAGDG